jgi:hypothetical protein
LMHSMLNQPQSWEKPSLWKCSMMLWLNMSWEWKQIGWHPFVSVVIGNFMVWSGFTGRKLQSRTLQFQEIGVWNTVFLW